MTLRSLLVLTISQIYHGLDREANVPFGPKIAVLVNLRFLALGVATKTGKAETGF